MQNHKLLEIAFQDCARQSLFSEKLGISKITSQILINRGINDTEEAAGFLKADLSCLLDPYSFAGMSCAVSLIRRAAERGSRVMVFGDYDVDGVTSVALVESVLSRAGLDTVHYIPHRIKDGYGLNKSILQTVKQQGIKLLITVDCGTNDYERVKELRRLGIDVIITDHHEPQGGQPAVASSIINPKSEGSGYGYRDLAGVGVAYKLCQAVCGAKLLDELDLVCLGTIADVVPLLGENRAMVKEGLSRLSRTARPGLKALIEASGIKGKRITATHVGYILGPRINASGRMDTAETALNLLIGNDKDEAAGLARTLQEHNRQRQKIENKMLEEARDLIDREINFKEHRVIVIAKEDWHQGVLGIVASKLADLFYRPTIIISKAPGLCKGSGRSIKNFHLLKALLECSGHLESFGGHSHAAGLTISGEKIEDFKDNINRLAREKLLLEHLLPTIEVDAEVGLSELSEGLAQELGALEPFGEGNPEPLLYTRNLRLKGAPRTLSRDTLKFWVSDGSLTRQVIGFGLAKYRDSLTNADYLDLVYYPRIDEWAGEKGIILEAREMFFR